MHRWLIAISTLLAVTIASAATVWTWVDENGQQHFSDRPVEGATQIEVQGAQGFTGLTPVPSAAAPGEVAETPTPGPVIEPYSRFSVVSPSQQETLWNIEGNLSVQVDLEPALQAGHRLNAYVDGALVRVGASNSTFTVPEVYRGLHTLQAVIMDANGQEVLRSLAVTFMVQQTSIQNPNNPSNRAAR